MYKTSYLYAILISFSYFQLHLLLDSAEMIYNETEFNWPKTNQQLNSYDDYVHLDYVSNESIPQAANEFEQKLLDAQIINDVMPVPPEKCLNVTFPHGELIPGQRLSLLQAWYQPNITYDADPNDLHTLILSCNSKYIPFSSESQPDTSLPETGSETAKWLVINIPGNNISAGQSLFNYTPPIRQRLKQVVDRYTFILYKQRFKIIDDWLPDPINGDFYRPGELMNESYAFAQYYKLVGPPIAANFFIMHW